MLMFVMQWGGSLAICAGFYFMTTRPALSAWCTIAGGCGLIVWALLLPEIAYGVVFLQSVVIALSARNLRCIP